MYKHLFQTFDTRERGVGEMAVDSGAYVKSQRRGRATTPNELVGGVQSVV